MELEPAWCCPEAEEAATLAALRAGDEEAFATFVVRHGAAMRRVACAITRDCGVAEEVVQETWLAVLRGLDTFEARSSLRTWVFRILVNRARTSAAREKRTVAFSALAEGSGTEAMLHPERLGQAPAPGPWTFAMADGSRNPEQDVLAAEVRALIARAITGLPPTQREVLTLRDVEGWTSEEVCEVLQISSVHQRVLLHRARTKVRGALEAYYRGT